MNRRELLREGVRKGGLLAAAGAFPEAAFPAAAEAGQANGALNLIHLTGAFALQAGIGVVIEQWGRRDGHYPLAAYQCALSLSVALQVAALVWYIRPEGSAWRERWLAEAKWFFRARGPERAHGTLRLAGGRFPWERKNENDELW